MSIRSSYFVSVLVPGVKAEDYALEAGRLADVLRSLFSDRESIAAVTKRVTLTACHTEVDVSYVEGEGLLGRTVIDLDAPCKVHLDKTNLSKRIKLEAPWKNLKIEKRFLPADDLEEPHALA